MTKEYKTGRLMVQVDNGTEKGFQFGMGNLVETVDAGQVEAVTLALAGLVDGKVEAVQASQTFIFRPQVQA